MPYFKQHDGTLAWLDEKDIAAWAKPDWVQIGDEETAELLKPTPQELADQEAAAALEQQKAEAQEFLLELMSQREALTELVAAREVLMAVADERVRSGGLKQVG